MAYRGIPQFQQTVLEYYQDYGRDLVWRHPEPDGSFDSYKIALSEVMLQQTQAGRVTPKYLDFLQRFPGLAALAAAPLAEVLRAWSGLGYNRRAKYLWNMAREVVNTYGGTLPYTAEELVKLPGIGTNTAGAIVAYAYNQPVVFVETNIRTVFIYHFFKDQQGVSDGQLREVIAHALPAPELAGPREWYWALMDYGTHLKATEGNLARQSKHHQVQSRFQGSRRQLRGAILRALLDGALPTTELHARYPDERLDDILAEMTREGLIEQHDNLLVLAA